MAYAVGGIYTVLKTKAPVTVDEYGGRYAWRATPREICTRTPGTDQCSPCRSPSYCLIGPMSHSSQMEVEEQAPGTRMAVTIDAMARRGIKVSV